MPTIRSASASLPRVEDDLAHVTEVAALPDPLEVPVLRYGAARAAQRAAHADAAQELLERGLDLRVDDRRPVVVVGGEDAARPQNSRGLGERRLRLHPVERLRAGDDVGRARREGRSPGRTPGRSGRCRSRRRQLRPERASRGSPRPRRPRRPARPRRESRGPSRCRDRRRAAGAPPGFEAQDVEQAAGGEGRCESKPAAKPLRAYPEAAQEPLAPWWSIGSRDSSSTPAPESKMTTLVSAAATAARRVLPHGLLDLLRQLAIWFGFLYAYRYTRGVADRDSYEAFQNGLRVADFEHRADRPLGALAPELRRVVAASSRADLVDVLALAVHGARPRAALGLPAAERVTSCGSGTRSCSRT